MNIYLIILLPIIAGAIGWFTNYLAVKMLFHPRKPIKILGYTLQGVFPKRQAQVAEKIGKLVADELLQLDDLIKEDTTELSVENIRKTIDRKLDVFFEIQFKQRYKVVSKMIPQRALDKIKEEVLKEVESVAPEFIQGQINHFKHTLDIEAVVESKVNDLSSEKLEKLIWNILSTEFVFIEWVGAALGFLIGIIQVLITLLLS